MAGNVHQLCLRAGQLAAGVIPPAAGLVPLFSDVLAHIRDRPGILAVDLNGGRKAQIPARQVENHVSRAVPVPAGHRFQRVGKKAVEVNCAVLVPFRHQDVAQPAAAHLVAEPGVEPLRDLSHVVPVDFLPVQGQRHEPSELVAERQVADLGPRPAHGPRAALRLGRSDLALFG